MSNINRIIFAFFLSSLATQCFAGPGPLNDFFDSSENLNGWLKWSPRNEISPSFDFDKGTGHQKSGSLKLSSKSDSDYGAWRKVVSDITPGENYIFSAWYRAENIPLERRSVIA